MELTVTELARNLSEYLNRVAYRGERFTVVRGGKPVATLAPVPARARLAELPGILAALPPLSEEEADAFTTDIEAARTELDRLGTNDPWAPS